jgi:YgiT-type zinc finger domain-containing protein
MTPFELCPVCGGEVIEKEVEKLILGGNTVVRVNAEVCPHCGERLYSKKKITFIAFRVLKNSSRLTILGNNNRTTSIVDLIKKIRRFGLEIGDRFDVGSNMHLSPYFIVSQDTI